MLFKYSKANPSQDELDSLPRLPLTLKYNSRTFDGLGLVDSGATVNVLPYEVGIHLGANWDDSQAMINLSGNLSSQLAMPLVVMTQVAELSSVRLVFAWTKNTNFPLILGQTNFFLEFDICFYRSKLELEVKPKSI